MKVNGNNQGIFAVKAAAFGDTLPEVTHFVRGKGKTRSVVFGARAARIVEAVPAKEREAAIVTAVVVAEKRRREGFKSNAGVGKVDTHAVMEARGATAEESTRTWRSLAPTRTRVARAKKVAAA